MSIMMLGISSKCLGDLLAISNYRRGIKITWGEATPIVLKKLINMVETP